MGRRGRVGGGEGWGGGRGGEEGGVGGGWSVVRGQGWRGAGTRRGQYARAGGGGSTPRGGEVSRTSTFGAPSHRAARPARCAAVQCKRARRPSARSARTTRGSRAPGWAARSQANVHSRRPAACASAASGAAAVRGAGDGFAGHVEGIGGGATFCPCAWPETPPIVRHVSVVSSSPSDPLRCVSRRRPYTKRENSDELDATRRW